MALALKEAFLPEQKKKELGSDVIKQNLQRLNSLHFRKSDILQDRETETRPCPLKLDIQSEEEAIHILRRLSSEELGKYMLIFPQEKTLKGRSHLEKLMGELEHCTNEDETNPTIKYVNIIPKILMKNPKN